MKLGLGSKVGLGMVLTLLPIVFGSLFLSGVVTEKLNQGIHSSFQFRSEDVYQRVNTELDSIRQQAGTLVHDASVNTLMTQVARLPLHELRSVFTPAQITSLKRSPGHTISDTGPELHSRLDTALNSFANKYGNVTSVAVYDKYQKVLLSVGATPTANEKALTHSSKTRELQVKALQKKTDQKPVIQVLGPLFDSSGLLTGTAFIEFTAPFLVTAKQSPGDESLSFNVSWLVEVSNGNWKPLLKTAAGSVLPDEALTSKSASDSEILVWDKEIAQTNLRLLAYDDMSSWQAPFKWLQQGLFMIAAISALIALASWYLVNRSFTRRIANINEAVAGLGQDEPPPAINDRAGDALSQIADKLDAYSSNLHGQIDLGSAIERNVKFQETHDELTGLLNRSSITESLQELVEGESGQEPGKTLSVLLLELKNTAELRRIDSGETLDTVIAHLGKQLNELTHGSAMMARWTQEQFLVVLNNGDDKSQDQELKRILQDLMQNLDIAGRNVAIDLHHGTSSSADSGELRSNNVFVLIAQAEQQIRDQKEIRSSSGKLVQMSAALVTDAIENRRIQVFYQPIYREQSSGSVTVSGAEALVRVMSQSGDEILTDKFLAHIQDHASGYALDRHVIKNAIVDLDTWTKRGIIERDFELSLNLSRYSINSHNIIELLRNLSINQGLALETLTLEISTFAMLQNPETVRAMQSLNCRLAIDDIVIRDLSLNQLQASRPDYIKVHINHLVDAVNESVEASEQLAIQLDYYRSLGITLIAKNIESKTEFELARSMGIKLYQGHYFAKPVNAEGFITCCSLDDNDPDAAQCAA